ncbi:hypothetical protein LPJ72_003450 [Coemansia sp. Benny D160-2]|nr:hypothetical protein LPJ72_003450 [Coemansia sp. Benny D160-2]
MSKRSSSSSPPPYENSPEPVFAQHSQTPVATSAARRIISTACTLSPRLKACTQAGAMEAAVLASGATGNGDTSDHGSLSQSAPTSPFISRLASSGGASAKTPSFAPLSPYALSASYNLPLLPRATSPASTTPTASVVSASSARVRTGSIGAILRAGRDLRPPVAAPATATATATAEQPLRLPHQRTLSVQSLAASGYTGSGSPTSAVAPGLERAASSSGSSSNRQSRRCSVAVSTNLSITQGLPVDPDRLDMDEDEDNDDDSDGYHSSGILSAHSDESDFEADDDSMDLDGVADAASVGQQSSLASAALTRRGRRSSHHHNHSNPMAHDVASAGSTPRNKAFERLRSLVEEDKQVLASEMEHEGQITRSIRHSSVQEWLRRSSSAGLSSSPGPAADDGSSTLTLAALRGSGSAARPTESSAPSMVSSPGLTTALNVAGAVAASVGPASGVSTVAYPPAGPGMLLCSAVPANRKRKIADDDGASSSGGDATTDEPSTPHSHQQYKRLAMSPSGLRVQIGMGASGSGSSSSSSRRVIFAPSQSGPSSPLLGSVSRPIAMAVSGGAHYPLLQGGVLGGGNGKSPINRVRSRSGAMPLGSSGSGYYGSASSIGSSGSGANIMQANGVFSRMNISDKKTGANQGPP